ncbi:MAG: colicin V production protein [Bacteroidetes bacterium 4572_77]|nr:MAG: colicin V production protein [Bacteroidetes bacterium 4572_77]
MGILDIIFIIPVVWLAYNGFKKGIIIEISTFVALLLGIYVSLYFSDITAEFLKEVLELKTKYLSIISFVVTFVLVIIAVNLLGKALSKLIDMAALGFINKSAGGVFGVLKAVIFLSFLILIIEKVDKKQVLMTQELKTESLFYPFIEPFAPELIELYGELDLDDIDAQKIKNKVLHPDI